MENSRDGTNLAYTCTGRVTPESVMYSHGTLVSDFLGGKHNPPCHALDLICEKNAPLRTDSSLEGQYANEDATALMDLPSRCLQYESRDCPDIKFLLSSVASLQQQKDVALTTMHDILPKTGHKGKEGAENEGVLGGLQHMTGDLEVEQEVKMNREEVGARNNGCSPFLTIRCIDDFEVLPIPSQNSVFLYLEPPTEGELEVLREMASRFSTLVVTRAQVVQKNDWWQNAKVALDLSIPLIFLLGGAAVYQAIRDTVGREVEKVSHKTAVGLENALKEVETGVKEVSRSCVDSIKEVSTSAKLALEKGIRLF